MRTMTSSLAKTCEGCGALNRLVIMTMGLTPSWRVGCSNCGATLVEARPQREASDRDTALGQPSAEIVSLPVPYRPAGGPLSERLSAREALARAVRHRRLPSGPLLLRASAGASTGVSFLAACGVIVAAMMRQPAPDSDVPVLHERVAALPAVTAVETSPEPLKLRQLADAGLVPGAPGAGSGFAGLPAASPPTLSYRLADSPPALPPAISEHRTASIADMAPAALPDSWERQFATVADLMPAREHTPAASWRLNAERSLDGRPAVYPDPLEGMMPAQLAAALGLEDAAAQEEALKLSAAQRREIQRRLRLASHDPRGIDGIFGPATRAALAAWQTAEGIPATGYMTEATHLRLAESTEAKYRAWAADRSRRARDRQIASTAPSPRPQKASTAADGCVRQRTGQIAYGTTLRCDVKGLRESLGTLRQNLTQLIQRPNRIPRKPGA